MEGTSKELQEISIVALLNDPYLLSKCLSEIRYDFYEDERCRAIYQCLSKHYKKYNVLPTSNELKMEISESIENKESVEEILSLTDNLYNQKISSIDLMYEKVTEFIRRNKIEESLNKILQYYQEGNINLDRVAEDLRDSVYINFSKASVLNLSDITSIHEVKTEALGDDENPIIIKFFIDAVNKTLQYRGIIQGTLNMIVAPPGRGKTTMMINQGVYTAQQGYKVLHVFLGDMQRFDGLLRYLSCFTGIPTSKLIDLSETDLAKMIQKYNYTGFLSNIDIASYPACQLTASQLVEEISTIQKNQNTHYNAIIIDYDENVAIEADSMYEAGGQLYNKMALFAVLNKSAIFILSQPKTEFWKQEVIPLESASESSKKQKIIDLMLTMGKPSKSSSIGTLFIAKNRRGEDSKVIRLKIDGSNARMSHISEDEYIAIKNKERNSDSD